MNEEKRKILKKLEVGTTYSGVDVICRQYKEIEILNNKIHDISETLNETYNDRTELRNENNRLKTELQDTKEHLGEYLHEQEEENKRLNNIINELEKWLKKEADFWKKQQEEAIKRGWLEFGGKYNTTIIYENAIDKLQELKGSNKEL